MGGQYADHAPSEYRFPFCRNIERRVSSKGLSRSCQHSRLVVEALCTPRNHFIGRRTFGGAGRDARPITVRVLSCARAPPRRVNQGSFSRAVQQHHHVQSNGHRQPRSGSTRRGPCSVGDVPHSAVRKWVQGHNVTKWPSITHQHARSVGEFVVSLALAGLRNDLRKSLI
jgi:hypothetical protein